MNDFEQLCRRIAEKEFPGSKFNKTIDAIDGYYRDAYAAALVKHVGLLYAIAEELMVWNKKYPFGGIYNYKFAKAADSALKNIIEKNAKTIANFEGQIK